MTVQEWEKDFYGNNVTITTRDNECVIYRIRDDSGDSVLTRFEVYPGIALIYNDVHTDYISIKELVGYENILKSIIVVRGELNLNHQKESVYM